MRKDRMQTLEEATRHVAQFYRLAFLLTRDAEISTNVALEAVDMVDDQSGVVATPIRESRRIVVSKAIAAIGAELRASVSRLRSQQSEAPVSCPNAAAIRDLTSADVQTALLSMDTLSRCAVVLRTLEGIPLEETATLLDVDSDLIREANAIGLRALVSSVYGVPV
jgi:hypothetical protein